MSDEDYTEEVFSDGDEDRGTPVGEGSFILENMIKPLARSGIRRLTGGRSKENDRLRESLRTDRRGLSQPLIKSPKVPPLPSAYLPNPASPGDAA
jgi:hypothetical protein